MARSETTCYWWPVHLIQPLRKFLITDLKWMLLTAMTYQTKTFIRRPSILCRLVLSQIEELSLGIRLPSLGSETNNSRAFTLSYYIRRILY